MRTHDAQPSDAYPAMHTRDAHPDAYPNAHPDAHPGCESNSSCVESDA